MIPGCARWKRRPRPAFSFTVSLPKRTCGPMRSKGLGLDGIRFRLHYDRETLHVHVPMIGRHSVETALRRRRGRPGGRPDLAGDSRTACGKGTRNCGWWRCARETGALMLDDTYNASPESMLAALNLLGETRRPTKDRRAGRHAGTRPLREAGHMKWSACAPRRWRTCWSRWDRVRTCIAEAARRAGHEASTDSGIRGQASRSSTGFNRICPRTMLCLIKGSHGLRMDRIVAALEVHS